MDSPSVCPQFRGKDLPNHVFIWKTLLRVSVYIPQVKRFYRSGRLGHISKGYTKEETCLTCSENHVYVKEVPCQAVKKCINCEGPHNTLDRSCPAFRKVSDVLKRMA